MKYFFTILIQLLITMYALGQTNISTGNKQYEGSSILCYDNKIDTSKDIFTRTEIAARYNGRAGFSNYLTENLSSLILLSNVKDSFFTDTVQVRFLIKGNATSKMSNLLISESKNKLFNENLDQVIKKSACNWVAGSFSGREVDCWVAFNIFYSVHRQKDNVSLQVGYEVPMK